MYHLLDGSKQQSFADIFDQKLIVSAEAVTLNKAIASGNFGAVYRAFLKDKDGVIDVVALKSVRDTKVKKQKDDARLALLKKEGAIMRKFNHKNVILLKVMYPVLKMAKYNFMSG